MAAADVASAYAVVARPLCVVIIAGLSSAGALGYGLNLLFLTIERRFVHWSGK